MKRLVGAILVLAAAVLWGSAHIALVPEISIFASIVLAIVGISMIVLGFGYRDDL